MEVGRTRRALMNISVSVINKIIVTFIPFVCRTVLIYTIGIEYVGLDSLFASVLSMLSVSELGFSSAIVYAMYKPVAEGDDNTVKALLTFYKRVYRIVGLLILGVGLALMPNIEWFIAEGTKYPQNVNIYLVYLVFLANTSLSYLLFGYKNSILVATMRNDIDSIIDTIRIVASYGFQIITLLVFHEYYIYILVLPAITICNNIIRAIVIDKKYPQFKGKSELSKTDKKEIMTRVGALVGNKIGGAVFTSVDSIVISKFLGLIVLAQYTNYYTVFAAVFTIETVIYTSFQSVVGNSLIENSEEKNYYLFKNLFFINIIITLVCVCCFTSLYQPFISLWVGKENVLGMEIPLLLVVYFFVKSTRRTLFTFYEAAGMWKLDFLKPYVSVICNLVVNIVLVKNIGLPGVIISSVLALVVVEMPWETMVFFKHYFHRSPAEYFGLIIKSFLICCIGVGISYFLCDLLPEGIVGIGVRLFVTSFLCAVLTIILILCTKTGKQIITRFGIKDKIERILKRSK